MVSLTVVFGADLNLDFSEKSGFEAMMGGTEGEEVFSFGAVAFSSTEGMDGVETTRVSTSASSDVTLLFFLIHPAEGSTGRAGVQRLHGPSSSRQVQPTSAGSCCS